MREEAVRAGCKEMTNKFPADQQDRLALEFMRRYAKASAEFAHDTSHRENVSDPQEKAARWQKFSTWVISELQAQSEAESERIRGEEIKAAANKAQALQLAMMAGI